jgi:hypothetical protein
MSIGLSSKKKKLARLLPNWVFNVLWLDAKFLDVYCVFNVLNVLVKRNANVNFFSCVFQTKRSTQIKRLP